MPPPIPVILAAYDPEWPRLAADHSRRLRALGSALVIERHIALRDYLRAHPEVAHAYENEKRRAQSLYPDDSHRYGDEKAAWIRDAEVEALDWYAQQRSGVISN